MTLPKPPIDLEWFKAIAKEFDLRKPGELSAYFVYGDRINAETLLVLIDRLEVAEAAVKKWEDHEVKKASCCVENEERAKRYEKALEFYAERNATFTDNGRIAREALAQTIKEPHEWTMDKLSDGE